VEQQEPRRQPTRIGRPGRSAGKMQKGLLPRLQEPLPHRHRVIPSRPRGGAGERERDPDGGAPAQQGLGRGHRGGTNRRRQRIRLPQGLRGPRRP